MQRGGQQRRVMEDCSTDERLQQETLCHRRWTDEFIERPETLMKQNLAYSRWLAWESAGRRSSSQVRWRRPCWYLYARTASLSVMCSEAFSQWSRQSSGLMCSNFDDENIRLAAAFSTDWSRCRRYAGMPVKVALPKSSRESTSETVIDWRTGLVTDRRIRRRWVESTRMVTRENTDFFNVRPHRHKCWGLERQILVPLSPTRLKVMVAAVTGGLDDWRTARWTPSY